MTTPVAQIVDAAAYVQAVRDAVKAAAAYYPTFSPCTTTDPPVGRSRPEIMLSMVDLPHPEGPITATASPARISSDTPSRAVVSPYSLRTPSSRTAASPLLSSVTMHRTLSEDGRVNIPPRMAS